MIPYRPISPQSLPLNAALFLCLSPSPPSPSVSLVSTGGVTAPHHGVLRGRLPLGAALIRSRSRGHPSSPSVNPTEAYIGSVRVRTQVSGWVSVVVCLSHLRGAGVWFVILARSDTTRPT